MQSRDDVPRLYRVIHDPRDFLYYPYIFTKLSTEYFSLIFIRIYHVWEGLSLLPVILFDVLHTSRRFVCIRATRLPVLKNGKRLSTTIFRSDALRPEPLLNKLFRELHGNQQSADPWLYFSLSTGNDFIYLVKNCLCHLITFIINVDGINFKITFVI